MVWKSLQEMSAVERKMYWAVRETAMLHEVPLEEQNLLSAGVEVVPAQDPAACSQVLLDWFDQGLATVTTTYPPESELDPETARALLADPKRWTPAHSLALTDAGDSALSE